MPTVMSIKQEKEYPIIPIRNGVVFPHTESVLVFGRSRSVAAIEKAHKENSMAVVVMQKDPSINEPTSTDLYTIGSLIKVEKLQRNTDDNGRVEINALIKGVERVQILSFESFEPYLVGKVVEIPEQVEEEDDEIKALCKHVSSQLRRAVSLGKSMDFISFMKITSGLNALELANQIASIVDTQRQERQLLLEDNDLKSRLNKIAQVLSSELRVLEIEKNIDNKTQKKFDQNFRKTVLEERLKTIEKELGKDGENREVKEVYDKIKKANMPADVEKKAKRELKRLSQMSNYNPESSYLRSYLDWLTDVPWNDSEKASVDMKKAEEILDEDHYGLRKVKERVIEYLAVMKLKNARQFKKATQRDKTDASSSRAFSPTILCLVGPPGVGKTSIGRSIARALNRKFVKMSLGGIRDEAEIRGHRRTYVGALPGRIIQGMKNANTTNPVFMLDEIDKLGNDFRGDPSSALLEALDPEQNFAFEDHYLEVPYDLSRVFFITTANVLDTIPPALRDRLEIIRFAGYTEDEKYNIAKKYLISKQEEVNALDDKEVVFTDKATHYIINRYTREAGVRSLEREIAKVLRKVARKIAEGMKGKYTVGVQEIAKLLGPEKFSSLLAEKKDEVGMVTGLAWTEAGGDILFIEVALMPGKGNLLLTGQLGDVMKESCQAAMSYVRTRSKVLGLKDNFYSNLDVHVHVPEGAVPKDGPSAGLAISTAIVSALIKIPVKKLVGMTGEVTLRGRALEIGGVKEKIIAAHRAGLKEIIMPKDNKKDLEEIPENVKNDLKFHFVKDVDEVLKLALTKDITKSNGQKKRVVKQMATPPLEPPVVPIQA
ncbi:MAG: Lon protease [Microgenomates group bacterium GW2011_GWC1_41_8]|nr:MAG: Lon protease [Microgenomates group bacterium GW2011_GWC1_41_8]